MHLANCFSAADKSLTLEVGTSEQLNGRVHKVKSVNIPGPSVDSH